MIELRFMTGKSAMHALIRAQERECQPFIPSHVDCVDRLTPGAVKYIGAHWDGGVLARDPGYDKDDCTDELFVHLPATDDVSTMFVNLIRSRIGTPYDLEAIVGFVIPLAMHEKKHLICSALAAWGLGKVWIPGRLGSRLACRPHCVSPRDLLLTLSGAVTIPELPYTYQPGASDPSLQASGRLGGS